VLSRTEIISYLLARQIPYKEVLYKDNFFILELNQEINIQELGGTINAGPITFTGGIGSLKKFIDTEDIIQKDKFTYTILGNFEDAETMLISKFKSEKRKAVIRHSRKSLHIQGGEWQPAANAEFRIFCFLHQEVFFGVVNQVFDSSKVKERDMKKPVRRESLAISPRLAKILINLTGAKPGDTLLDPFCGIGGILMEASLMGISAIGIDKDKEAVTGARQNLRWLEKYNKIAPYDIVNADSRLIKDSELCESLRKIGKPRITSIACEPSLGRLVRKKPGNTEAINIIRGFEAEIIGILRRLKNVKQKDVKVAITFPFIREYSVNIDRVCKETGLRLSGLSVQWPLKEFREDQFISRDIYVLE
jgi:tRNA G10  N-methylase Trm11